MLTSLNPLNSVLHRVLGEWAMMLVEPADDAATRLMASEKLYCAQVEIRGAFDGTLSIVAAPHFLQVLTANLLGETDENDLHEAELSDAFREMGNVLAGNYITTAYGADVPFDLLNPLVGEIDHACLVQLGKSSQTCSCIADDVPVFASFSLHEAKHGD